MVKMKITMSHSQIEQALKSYIENKLGVIVLLENPQLYVTSSYDISAEGGRLVNQVTFEAETSV